MKKKVALMTWYTYRNYGTALQACALYKKIEDLGYDVSVIRYRPKDRAPARADLGYFVGKVRERLRGGNVWHSAAREALFQEFIDARIKETEPAESWTALRGLNGRFDAFVCGSDQIWSPSCTDEHFFLDFVEDGGKKLAYAPSFGVQEYDGAQTEKTALLLRDFQYLTVREGSGAAIVKSLTGREVGTALDPTLLFSPLEWDAYAQTETAPKVDEAYIFCYFLGEPSRYEKYVKKLAKKTGLSVVSLAPGVKKEWELPFAVGPREFLSLMRNAKYVCTDSFHGTAFALLYNLPFTAFPRFKEGKESQNSRIRDLLTLVGLSSRFVSPSSAVFKTPSTLDFTWANAVLDRERRQSLAFLQESLLATTEREGTGRKRYYVTKFCCGCGACKAVCPRGAIAIEKNADGFLQYKLNEEKCIRCGRCREVCPFYTVSVPNLQNAAGMYAMKSVSGAVLARSSSGGVAHELAKGGLSSGLTVCGCKYEENDREARHILLASKDRRKVEELQGSKYLQSRTAEALERIAALSERESVLFFGTPCQVAGLDKLLRKKGKRENVIFVDLICHGVPSYLLWERFLDNVNARYGTGEAPRVNFRAGAWRKRKMQIRGGGKGYERSETEDDFYAFFRQRLCLMPACYECSYRERSAADIRLGDYWGERFATEQEGMSMVICNTARGEKLVHALEEDGTCMARRLPLEEYWKVQFPYNPPKPAAYEEILADLREGENLNVLRKRHCATYERLERTRGLKKALERMLGKERENA